MVPMIADFRSTTQTGPSSRRFRTPLSTGRTVATDALGRIEGFEFRKCMAESLRNAPDIRVGCLSNEEWIHRDGFSLMRRF